MEKVKENQLQKEEKKKSEKGDKKRIGIKEEESDKEKMNQAQNRRLYYKHYIPRYEGGEG